MLKTTSNTSETYTTFFATNNQREIISLINMVILSGVVCLLGTVANAINLVVFYREGLDTTINISFFSLAVADLCSLVLQQFFNVYVNPLFVGLDLPIVYLEVQYMTTSIPREMFARITCLMTAFITAERCLCVVFPLHVKRIITPKTATAVSVVIFSCTLLSAAPIYFTTYLTWQVHQDSNTTLLGLAFGKHSESMQSFVYFTHGLFTLIGFLSVITFTLILIFKLGQKSAWRQTANADQEKAKSMSKRDRATIQMVVLIACILVACYTPAVLLSITTFIVPEFSASGSHYNICYILWSYAVLFENINSSVNIFLYYKMSSKYRQTFQEFFSGCFHSQKKV